MNQIIYHRRETVVFILRPPVFNRHVAAFNVTSFAQPIEKARQLLRVIFRRGAIYKPDHRHRSLLRGRSERPSESQSNNNFDEISPAHVTLRSEVKHDASFESLSDPGGGVRFGSKADIGFYSITSSAIC